MLCVCVCVLICGEWALIVVGRRRRGGSTRRGSMWLRRCSWAVGLAVLGLAVVLGLGLGLGLAVLAVARAERVSRSGWTSRCFERR